MLRQKALDVSPDVGHGREGIGLALVDPSEYLLGTVGFDVMVDKPAGQFFQGQVFDVLIRSLDMTMQTGLP